MAASNTAVGRQKSVYFSHDELRAIEVLAEREKRSGNQIIRLAVGRVLEEAGLDPAKRSEWDTDGLAPQAQA